MTPPAFNTTAGFLARFVEPLLGGGSVEVEAPLSAHDRAQMLNDAAPLLGSGFLHLRERVAQQLVAEPALPEPGADELSLWLGLHDVLALDHPDTERVWTRDSTWAKVETEARSLLAFARPTDMADALARHLAVGAFLRLRREDHLVSGPDGEQRFRGQQPPRRRFGLFSPAYADVSSELVNWIDQPHATVVDRLLPDVMWVSPLTSLLRPAWAPPGWSPLMAVEFLQSRPYARAVCHTWAREREWLRVGGIVAGSLLRSLNLHTAVFSDRDRPHSAGAATNVRTGAIPGVSPTMQRAAMLINEDRDDDELDEPAVGGLLALAEPAVTRRPEDIGAVVAALIHLHVLKVLEFDARISIGLGARDWAVQSFLALPLLLPVLEQALGSPFGSGGTQDSGRLRLGRWRLARSAEARASSSRGERRRFTTSVFDGGPGGPGLPGAEQAFVSRWNEYCEHLAGLVPRPVVDRLLVTLARRIL